MRCLVPLLAAASLATAQPAAWHLNTSTANVTFSAAAGGGITSFTDRADGRELAATSAADLFELAFTDPADPTGKRTSVGPRDAAALTGAAQNRGGRQTLQLTWKDLAGKGVTAVATFSAAPGDPLLRCRLSASFPAGMALEFVRFPVLALRSPLHDAGGDAFVCGATKGGVFRQPSTWQAGRWVAFGQPGNLAAQFGCYYDPAGGVYTAALDSHGQPKGISASRTDNGVALQWYAGCYAVERYETGYDIVLAPFHGNEATDWRDAADLYRSWAVRQPWAARPLARRDDLPAWIRNGPAMVRFNRDFLARPDDLKAWLRDYYHRYFPDVPLVVAYWGWEKVETWITPDYFPCFPSDETFNGITAFARGLGGHSFLWPSGYHYTVTYHKQPDGSFAWDDRARFDAVARQHAVVGRNGQVTIGDRSWLRGGQTATMCPGDRWTRDWFTNITAQIARRGGEIVQVDQVVGGAFPACFNPDHGHPVGPGAWQTAVFRQQLAAMRTAGRKLQRDFVVCFEEPNEWYLDLVGWQDYRDWENLGHADMDLASVFGYVYHDYVPAFQSNPRLGDKLMTAYQLVNGQVPQFVPTRPVGPGPAMTGDMESFTGDVPDGWDRVSGWQGVQYTGVSARDTGDRHGGAASLRLTNTEANQIVQVSRNLMVGAALLAGHTYRLSGWLKSRGSAQPGGIMLGLFAPGLKSTGGARLDYPAEPAGWARSEAAFTVAPSSEMLRIMVHLQGPGTVWVDDLVLEEQRPGGAWGEVMRPERPADHELMRQWVALFHGAGRPYLLLGKLLHPPHLECAEARHGERTWPAILHNAYAAPDGTRAVVLVNATDEPQAGRLLWGGKRVALELKPWEVRLAR